MSKNDKNIKDGFSDIQKSETNDKSILCSCMTIMFIDNNCKLYHMIHLWVVIYSFMPHI